MPRDLFGDVTRPSISIGNRKWYTVPLSLFTHSLAIGLLVALPLLAPAVMPAVLANDLPEWIPTVLPPPPPPPKRPPIEKVEPISNLDAAPTTAPDGITPEKPRVESGWEDAQPGPGVINGIPDPLAVVAPPPSRQPRWAAESTPRANPLATTMPRRASSSPRRFATSSAYGVAPRDPTIATVGRLSSGA